MTVGQRTNRWVRRAAAVGVVVATVAAALALAAGTAFAHHPVLSGETTCNADGTWNVAWEALNPHDEAVQYMLVRAVSVSAGTLEGITANATYTGVVNASHPDASEGGGTIAPPSGGGRIHFSTPNLPNSVASVTLNLTGYWHYPDGNGGFVTAENPGDPATVTRPEGCTDTRPGHITVVKSTTGDTAPAGPFTFRVNQDNTTVTTITVPKNGSATSGDLAPGTYTLVELDAPTGATIVPNPVTVDANTTVTVHATNTYPDGPAPVPPVIQVSPAEAAAAPAVIVAPQFTG
jgi:uncharacterized surface anchored protein